MDLPKLQKKNREIQEVSKGKVGYSWESTRDIYQHIPPIDGLYNGCIGQYGVMFWEQLLGYLPKGTQNVPLKVVVSHGFFWIPCQVTMPFY